MKLKNKIVIVSVISIIAFCAVTLLIRKIYIFPAYRQIEYSEAGKDICRAVEALKSQELVIKTAAEKISKLVFIDKEGDLSIRKNKTVNMLKDVVADFCFIYNNKNKLKYSCLNNLKIKHSGELKKFKNFLNKNILPVRQGETVYSKTGLINSCLGTLIISYEPVFDRKGTIIGSVIVGIQIDKKYIDKFSNITGVPVNIEFLPSPTISGTGKKLIRKTQQNYSIYFSRVKDNDEYLKSYAIITGVNNKNDFLISTRLSRLIYLEAHSMIEFALYVLIIFGILLIVITTNLIHYLVVVPISRLTKSTVKIRNSENLSLRTEFGFRKDEVGTLSEEFNSLLGQLQHHIENMEEIIGKQTEEIRLTREDTIFRISMAIDDKDMPGGRHITRVSEMVVLLSEKLGISRKKSEIYGIASTMHDIGKIGIPESILSKTGKYTEKEFETMKVHTKVGAKIFSKGSSDLIKAAHDIALYHHERWDGKGYPEGLQGEKIPIAARITSIVDVFDAFLSGKPYKEAHSIDEAAGFFKENKGVMFDPEIVEVFLENMQEFIVIREKHPDNI
ncbi:MAG: HD domain-containing protein [Victivallales bacterium]|nr:HD domain-containing protein [Victivallales bacterium]MCF7888654.1 HD domain-containing protein [Victivallales bacterium]